MALAKGKSSIRVNKPITEHTQAAIYTIKQFLPAINIEIKEEEKSAIIAIEGISYL